MLEQSRITERLIVTGCWLSRGLVSAPRGCRIPEKAEHKEGPHACASLLPMPQHGSALGKLVTFPLFLQAFLCYWPPAPTSCKSFAFPDASLLLVLFLLVFFFFLLISPQEGEGLPHFLCLGNKSSLWICTWGGRSWFPLPASSGQIFEGNCSVQGHLARLITVKSTFIRAGLGVGTIEKIFMGKMSFQKTRIWTSN